MKKRPWGEFEQDDPSSLVAYEEFRRLFQEQVKQQHQQERREGAVRRLFAVKVLAINILLFTVAALAFAFLRGPSVCTEAYDVARKIGATIDGEAGEGMVAFSQTDAGEITFGCPPRSLLVVFAKPGRPHSEFFSFISTVGSAYTGEAVNKVRPAVEECVWLATTTRSRFARLPFGKFTLDCTGGINGGPPKVTFESS